MFRFLIGLENSTSSPGQGEESSAESFADIPASALSKLNLTHERFCFNDSATESCHVSPFGTMCEHSTANHGEGRLISCAEASRARIFPALEKAQESKETVLECGWKWHESSVKYDRNSRSWKTRQCSLLEGLDEFLETWPKWGMMRGGECLEVPTPERATTEKEFGFLPTPNASDCRSRGNFAMESIRRRVTIGKQIGLSNYFKGAPCPICVERVMRWPMGWTGLEPLETDKIHFVQPSLGNSFQEWLDINAKALETSFQYDTRREKTKK